MRRLLVRVQPGVLNQNTMPTYINVETGETRSFSKTRTYINPDGTRREIDVATGEELSPLWKLLTEAGDYKNVAAKKSSTDGPGIR